MRAVNRDDELFEALLTAATSEAMRREFEDEPSDEELNTMYKSEALDSRIYKLINQETKKQKRKQRFNTLGKIAASIAIVFTVMTAALMSVEATRVRIINTILDWQKDHVQIEPGTKSETPISSDGISRPTYLPKGFSETEIYSFGLMIEIIYRNSEGDEIIFKQNPAEESILNLDNEYTEYDDIIISGNEAHLFIAKDDDTRNQIIWISGETLYSLSSFVYYEELVFIAESIK